MFRDIEIGRSADSPAILMKQEDTSEGYFVLFLNDKRAEDDGLNLVLFQVIQRGKGKCTLIYY